MENIYTVLITIVTTLGGASMWKYFEKRAANKETDAHWLKNDCKSRILKLEMALDAAEKQKDELRALVLHLSTEVASLTEQVKYLMNNKPKSI